MVFFTCNGCGESLKKNKVEKHTSVCRTCNYLTCIDCSKDFWGETYQFHTSCISEMEKYSAAGSQFKPNKGELKQNIWIKKIEQASEFCDPNNHRVKDLIQKLKDYENIPRKRGKFLNFLKNSLKIKDTNLIEEVWETFQKVNDLPVKSIQEKLSSAPQSAEKNLTKQGSKRKLLEANKNQPKNICLSTFAGSSDSDQQFTDAKKFPWNKTIKVCLKQSSNHEMSIKKLCKKMYAEYEAFNGDKKVEGQNDFKAVFMKKINKSTKFTVAKDRVRL